MCEEQFVHVLALGEVPHTRHVRGSNMTLIGVVLRPHLSGRAIVCSALDNLVKGVVRPSRAEHELDAWLYRRAAGLLAGGIVPVSACQSTLKIASTSTTLGR